MSGHSKWSTIKRQKGVADARRGQLFTKLGREIVLAVRQGGAAPDMNPRLRLAVQKARDNNMPLENIERAIKKGSGDLEGAALVETTYEGYGPGGVALLLEALTDNRNRTLQEIRSILSRGGGSLGESGSVSWLFERQGVTIVDAQGPVAEEVALTAIDAGADDFRVEAEYVEVQSKPEDLAQVRRILEERGYKVTSAELVMAPKSVVELDEATTVQVLKLIDRLEGMDDMQRVFSNAEFSDAALQQYQF
jgi:YebC/PmpR family DNA-binding regulatory protein